MSFEKVDGWHNALFEGGYYGACKIKMAKFRNDEMQVVLGLPQRLQIHYEAVLAERIEDEMANFLIFINKSSDNPYIKSAIAHLWFAIIHPYDDGNGRLARAFGRYCLPDSKIKFYSISSVIYANKNCYYDILEQTTKLNNNPNFDFTPWIGWHLEAAKSTISSLKKQI